MTQPLYYIPSTKEQALVGMQGGLKAYTGTDSVMGFALGELYKDNPKSTELALKVFEVEGKDQSEAASYAKLCQGLLYLHGKNGVEQNIDKAIALFKECDLHYANYTLGAIYLRGLKGVPKDTQLGLKYLEKAASQGNNLALTYSGLIHWFGLENQPQDQQKARDELKLICWTKNYHMPFLLQRYPELNQESKDYIAQYVAQNGDDGAIGWISRAESSKRSGLYEQLGLTLLKGTNNVLDSIKQVSRRVINAWVDMFNEAPTDAKLPPSQAEALTDLGRLRIRSKDFDQGTKYQIAVKYWQRAADSGCVRAKYYLGLAYASGRGVKKDLETAKSWLKVAEADKYLPASVILNHLEKKTELTLEMIDHSQDKLQLPPKEEAQFIKSEKSFLGKAWTYFKKHIAKPLLITTVSITAITAGLGALTICFPHIMIPIYVVGGTLLGAGAFMLLLFAAGSGDRGARRLLRI